MEVFKKKTYKLIPENAEIVMEKGERFAKWTNRKKTHKVPIVEISEGERIVILSRNYVARYKDETGTPLAKFAIGRYREGRPGGVSSSSVDVMGEQCRQLGRSSVRNFGLAERIADTFQSESAASEAQSHCLKCFRKRKAMVAFHSP